MRKPIVNGATSGPLVSVVIIFLNTERYLEEAIESVFAQSHLDWELLLVDDGSTDGSTAIARGYAARHPGRVRYLEHEGHQNRGMSASRNLGIRHARGDLIAFLDADDVWFPPTLEEQVAALQAHPEAGVAYGQIQYWHSWTGDPADLARDRIEPLGVPANSLVRPPTLLPLFLQDRAAVPSGILVRREVFGRIGGFEEQFRGEYEDQVFCAKLCLHETLFASDRCWYRYRQHPASSVSVGHQTGQTYLARARFLTWLENYLREQKVRDPRIWRALYSELWPFRQPRLFQWVQRWRAWWTVPGARPKLRILYRTGTQALKLRR
jgi:glycosyltransferase involved in cell wall biosynthesis